MLKPFIVAALLTGTCLGQSLPDSPKPTITKDEWFLLGVDLGVRELDTYSTTRALRCTCNHEMFLPDVISHHAPVMATYGVAVVATEYFAVRYFEKHHHHRLAILIPSIDIAQDGVAGIANFRLRSK